MFCNTVNCNELYSKGVSSSCALYPAKQILLDDSNSIVEKRFLCKYNNCFCLTHLPVTSAACSFLLVPEAGPFSVCYSHMNCSGVKQLLWHLQGSTGTRGETVATRQWTSRHHKMVFTTRHTTTHSTRGKTVGTRQLTSKHHKRHQFGCSPHHYT